MAATPCILRPRFVASGAATSGLGDTIITTRPVAATIAITVPA